MRSRHHILNNRQEWSLRPYAQQLRTTQSLVPPLEREVHNELHKECPSVPLLGVYALQNTVRLFNPTGDTLTDMDLLTFAIEQSSKSNRFHPIEKELALLAMEAIQIQKPFIKEGIMR